MTPHKQVGEKDFVASEKNFLLNNPKSIFQTKSSLVQASDQVIHIFFFKLYHL